MTYKLGFPPVDLGVVRRVAHAPEEGLAARDEVAEAARGDEEKGEHAEAVKPVAVAIFIFDALLGSDGLGLGYDLFVGAVNGLRFRGCRVGLVGRRGLATADC